MRIYCFLCACLRACVYLCYLFIFFFRLPSKQQPVIFVLRCNFVFGNFLPQPTLSIIFYFTRLSVSIDAFIFVIIRWKLHSKLRSDFVFVSFWCFSLAFFENILCTRYKFNFVLNKFGMVFRFSSRFFGYILFLFRIHLVLFVGFFSLSILFFMCFILFIANDIVHTTMTTAMTETLLINH